MGYDEGGPLPPFSQYEPQVGQSRPVGSAHGSAAAETGRSGTRGSMRGSTRGSSRFSKPGSRGGSAFSKVAGFKQAGGSEDFTTYQVRVCDISLRLTLAAGRLNFASAGAAPMAPPLPPGKRISVHHHPLASRGVA
jgi:hypothetical protein